MELNYNDVAKVVIIGWIELVVFLFTSTMIFYFEFAQGSCLSLMDVFVGETYYYYSLLRALFQLWWLHYWKFYNYFNHDITKHLLCVYSSEKSWKKSHFMKGKEHYLSNFLLSGLIGVQFRLTSESLTEIKKVVFMFQQIKD